MLGFLVSGCGVLGDLRFKVRVKGGLGLGMEKLGE